MPFEMFKDWMTLLGLSGVVGAVFVLIVKAVIDRTAQNREHRWQDERLLRDRALDTDRGTYNQPITIVVREHLAEYIRTGAWSSEDEELRKLLAGLSQRTYEHFLDPVVNKLWENLVRKSVEFALHRRVGRISEVEIREYNRLRTEWEDACKRSFGPLPALPDELGPRQDSPDRASNE